MKKNVNCPVCGKILAKLGDNGKMENAYLYCKRCKEEIFLKEVSIESLEQRQRKI